MPEDGAVARAGRQLPVTLPMDVEWKPTGEARQSLHPTLGAQTTCPVCGKPAMRETDTMDNVIARRGNHRAT